MHVSDTLWSGISLNDLSHSKNAIDSSSEYKLKLRDVVLMFALLTSKIIDSSNVLNVLIIHLD
jgi:hypothetical protein